MIFPIRNLNKCDWYIGLWCIYFLQGSLYPVGGLLSQSILMLQLSVSIYYAFYANGYYKLPIYYKALNKLILMFSIYGIFMFVFHGSKIYSPSGQSIPTKNYLQTIYSSLLSLYPCYVFAKKGLLTPKRLQVWSFVFFAVATASFFREERERLARLLSEGIDASETTNNSGYIFVSLIPLLVLFKNKPLIQYAGIAYCMYFILIGMKRGAILVGALCLILFLYQSFKNASGKKKMWTFVLILLLLFIGNKAVSFFVQNSSYMQGRIEQTMEGNTSGRDETYTHLLNHFSNDSNPLTIMFGNGAEGAFHSVGYIAHNDWLEILLGQGLVGIFIYLLYWHSFFRSWREEQDGNIKVIIGLLLLICLTKTFFSMSYQTMSIYTNSLLALCLSKKYNCAK